MTDPLRRSVHDLGRVSDIDLGAVMLTLVANNNAERTTMALYAAIVAYARVEAEHARDKDDRGLAHSHSYLGHQIGESAKKAMVAHPDPGRWRGPEGWKK